jgi:hypothetical protein
MRSSALIAAVLAAATLSFTIPAEAKRTSTGSQARPIDVAAIPAYPMAGQQKQPRAASRKASRSAEGAGLGQRSKISRRASRIDANGNTVPSFITVSTAAGIDIQVAPEFAAPAKSVIADLVAGGHTPRKITCRSFAKSHVANSWHFRNKACDVEQGGWGISRVPKALMRAAVARAGLRDGCEFGDHGHFDMGPHLPIARVLRNCGAAYAAAVLPVAFAAHKRGKIRLASRVR